MELLRATPLTDRVMPGDTGLDVVMLFLIISLTFNLVCFTVCAAAICCMYKELLLWPCYKPRRKAEHDVYYISKYGERVHSTDKCETLKESTDLKKFKPCSKCFKVVNGPKVA